jgi:RNA polymerase sigma-70 factor (ECF subfamily)
MGTLDPTILEHAYGQLSSRVYSSAYGVLRDAGRAEDVTQEVFLRLWRNPTGYDPERGELSSYLQLMARSRALDLWRSEQVRLRARERLDERVNHEPRPVEDGPEALAERHSDRSILLAALDRIPKPQREAVALVYFGGLTLSEVARRCRIPLGTAKSRVRMGLERLEREVAEVCESRLAATA